MAALRSSSRDIGILCARTLVWALDFFASMLPRDIFNTYMFPHLIISLLFESNGPKKVSPTHCGLSSFLPFFLSYSFFVPTLCALPLPINHLSTMASTSAFPQSPQSPYSAPSPADSQGPQQGLDGVVIEADVCMIVLFFPSSFLSPVFLSTCSLPLFVCLFVCLPILLI